MKSSEQFIHVDNRTLERIAAEAPQLIEQLNNIVGQEVFRVVNLEEDEVLPPRKTASEYGDVAVDMADQFSGGKKSGGLVWEEN